MPCIAGETTGSSARSTCWLRALCTTLLKTRLTTGPFWVSSWMPFKQAYLSTGSSAMSTLLSALHLYDPPSPVRHRATTTSFDCITFYGLITGSYFEGIATKVIEPRVAGEVKDRLGPILRAGRITGCVRALCARLWGIFDDRPICGIVLTDSSSLERTPRAPRCWAHSSSASLLSILLECLVTVWAPLRL